MNAKTVRRPTKRSAGSNVPTTRSAPAAPAAKSAPSRHDELVAVKRSLEAIALKLNEVDPQSLSDADHAKWTGEMNKVDLAIARVRNSLLEGIAAEFEAAMSDIQSATAKLEANLAGLQKAVDVINAVAGALGVLEQIIALGH
jgi:hypothetical protein